MAKVVGCRVAGRPVSDCGVSGKTTGKEWMLCQEVSGPWHVVRGGSGRVSGEVTEKDGGR